MKTYTLVAVVAPDGVYPDAFIDYWGEIYLANPFIRARGVLFESFLLAPTELLQACAQAVAPTEPLGLSPAQRAIQRSLDRLESEQQLALPLDQAAVSMTLRSAA